MKYTHAIVAIGLILGGLAVSGCQSKKQRLADLSKEYDAANKQYYTDCIAPSYGGEADALAGKKTKTPIQAQWQAHQQQCVVERAKVGKLLDQITDAESK